MTSSGFHLPVLTVQRDWLREFLEATTPCFALGLVEEHGQSYACLALRPHGIIPPSVTDGGFHFGHRVWGAATFEVIQFTFHFDGFATYHALVNPNNPIARVVLAAMMGRGEYFFFAVSPQGSVTAFRSRVDPEDLAGLTEHDQRLAESTTTAAQYQTAVLQFGQQPEPPGYLLDWICCDDIGYLDLTHQRMVLKPK